MRVSTKEFLKKINFNTETDSVKIRPLPKPPFYDSEADIVIYGGSVGSGKIEKKINLYIDITVNAGLKVSDPNEEFIKISRI